MRPVRKAELYVPKRLQLRSMLDIAEVAGWGVRARLCECVLDGFLVLLQYQSRMIAELPKVLQRLEDVLLLAIFLFIRPYNVLGFHLRTRFREVVIQELLKL